MVAQTIQLPNIRKLFKPDPGYCIIDCDFDQADARVVAWDADVPKLKAIFNDPTKDLHGENAITIFGENNARTRPLAKRGVHAVNYLITQNALANSLGISRAEAKFFMDTWFANNPEIAEWHARVEHDLASTRTIYNAFGYRKVYYDRIDRVLSEAVAWIPQSTVAIAINKALYNIYKNLPQVQILIQVHDSLVMQFPKRLFPEILPKIKQQMTIEIPYKDLLYLPTSAEISAISWGGKQPVTWEGEFKGNKKMTPFAMKVAAGF